MLQIENLTKSYGESPVLRGVSFSLSAGQRLALLGPSGSGKSTLLRLIAGLENPDAGRVLWQGADLAGVPVHARRFGFVFQDYALFPHLTVWQNVAYGPQMQGWTAARLQACVRAALAQVALQGFEDRRVTDLSGGEQQRVALARALVWEPRLLMLDEPLGALDRALRTRLLGELREILQSSGVPALYVTHDQEEAFALADRVLILHEGVIVQDGTPETIFHAPASAWVARFLGLGSLLPGEVEADGSVVTALGRFVPASAAPRRGRVSLLLRPESACLGTGRHCLAGVVSDCLFLPNGRYRVRLHHGVEAVLPHPLAVGETVSLCFERVDVLPDD